MYFVFGQKLSAIPFHCCHNRITSMSNVREIQTLSSGNPLKQLHESKFCVNAQHHPQLQLKKKKGITTI